jgi:hypothetical protein
LIRGLDPRIQGWRQRDKHRRQAQRGQLLEVEHEGCALILRSDLSALADRFRAEFPAPAQKAEFIPCSRELFPCSSAQGIHLANY